MSEETNSAPADGRTGPPPGEPGLLRSASAGRFAVVALTVIGAGLELDQWFLRAGDPVRAALTAGLLWALWLGKTWARLISALLCAVGGGYGVLVFSPRGPVWLLAASAAMALLAFALVFLPGVDAFMAERRSRSAHRAP